MDNPIQVDLGRIAQDLQIRRLQVESVVQLLDEGNTVPFITRYRKEQTGNLNEVVIGEIQLRVRRLRELADRKETILKAIEAQGKLVPDLATAIRAAENLKRLEDLYLPFKPKKRTKASDARDRGLEPLAFRVWTRDETLTDLAAAAQEFVSAEKGVESIEKVLEGVEHILAEAISEMATVRDAVRKVVWKTGRIVTAKAEIPEGQGLEYRDYFEYSEPVAQIPPHRVLAINRGDKEGPLKVRLDVPRPEVEAALFGQLPLEGHPHVELFRSAAVDSVDRLILPSMEREVRRDLTEAAERHAVEVFAKNLRSLLLQPPIPKQVVMAIDPGFKTGCKVAVLDRGGDLLDQGVIYPHPPQNRRSDAKLFLKDLVGKHQIGVVAIGNGTACRETEELVAEIIAEGTQFSQGDGASPGVAEPAPPPAEPAPPPAEPPPSVAVALPEHPLADMSSLESPWPHSLEQGPVSSGETPEDGTVLSESHSASEPHHSPTAEAPLEALPPISGGAPDSPAPEAEIEASSGASPPSDTGPNVLRNGGGQGQGDDPGTRPAEPEAGALPEATPHHEPVAAEGHADSSPGAEPGPTAESPELVPGPSAQPVEAAAATSPGQAQAAGVPPAAPLARGPRSTGHGRPESSRSRPPRNRHASSPPQEPPKPHPADALLAQLAYVVVNEAGASVYSTSQVGRDELPDSDATLRSGISIGRRLQDPLAELVKIEPQNIGVGLYQHDVNPKQLKDTLEAVISSCVNFVGVDLNTASVSLLRHVSGLNHLTARRIVEYRKEHGPFAGRDQLTQVEGIGPASYTQAAGFLKIPEGQDPLDRTWIHPENYAIVTSLLEKAGFTPDVVRDKVRLPELRARLAEPDFAALARELGLGDFTLRDIIEALARPERDPREDLPKPIFKKGVLKIEDLSAGMELKGTVLNVVDFGAFVDIGLKDSGLVHISQLANRYVKSPHDVVSVGDVVTVWVMGVDQERKRVSLTMVKPGMERQRGANAGSRRGGGPGGEPRDREG
ncbi:MAG: Tex-like N-terminal domain-containing protein, partial [Isosphaerales bacterium]